MYCITLVFIKTVQKVPSEVQWEELSCNCTEAATAQSPGCSLSSFTDSAAQSVNME